MNGLPGNPTLCQSSNFAALSFLLIFHSVPRPKRPIRETGRPAGHIGRRGQGDVEGLSFGVPAFLRPEKTLLVRRFAFKAVCGPVATFRLSGEPFLHPAVRRSSKALSVILKPIRSRGLAFFPSIRET
jgi:hypothetical protein